MGCSRRVLPACKTPQFDLLVVPPGIPKCCHLSDCFHMPDLEKPSARCFPEWAHSEPDSALLPMDHDVEAFVSRGRYKVARNQIKLLIGCSKVMFTPGIASAKPLPADGI
jgi:hypothetical protein